MQSIALGPRRPPRPQTVRCSAAQSISEALSRQSVFSGAAYLAGAQPPLRVLQHSLPPRTALRRYGAPVRDKEPANSAGSHVHCSLFVVKTTALEKMKEYLKDILQNIKTKIE